MRIPRQMGLITLLSIAVFTAVNGTARADFATLAQRLPAETTSIVAVDVAAILASPYATEQQWADTMAENWAKRPQIVPPGVNLLLMGSDMMPSTMESAWEVCLMEMDEMPDLDALVNSEGGHVDRVWDKDACVSPIGAYFIPLDPTTLAVATPAERRPIAKWIRQPARPDNVSSEYIRGVLKSIGTQTHVVMATDLEGAVSVPKVRLAIEEAEIPELKGLDLDSVAMTIGSLKGATLTMMVTSDIVGKLVLDFDRNTSTLGLAAKPLTIAALQSRGMRVDDLDSWTFNTMGTQVTATGKLSEKAFKRLLGIVQSPVPTVVALGQAPAKPEEGANDAAAASQRYYKAVALNLDNLQEGAAMSESATWFRNAATRIDHLPILNVDPALLEWGALVSTRLKQAAATLNVNQTTASARVAGVKNPDRWGRDEYSGGHYDNNGYYHWGHSYETRESYENARMERRKEGAEQRAKGNEQALKILNDIAGQRQEVRAQMTAKYGVEF